MKANSRSDPGSGAVDGSKGADDDDGSESSAHYVAAELPPIERSSIRLAATQGWVSGTGITLTDARIGRFEVIRELGRGGMGVVYLARDEKLGRKVAIKLLRSQYADFTRRFIQEARVTTRCSHENIVVTHEVGEYRGSPFMVLEYLEGQTLAAVLKTTGPLAAPRAAEWMVAVVRALVCAHSHGIVHRNLKPENILLTQTGRVKVLEFGIGKVLTTPLGMAHETVPSKDDTRPCTSHGLAGTLAYMSPEQWGVDHVDTRTDIWAAGIILFEMLTGVHPLSLLGQNPRDWVSRLDWPMPSLQDAAPQLPAALVALVDGCLRKVKLERTSDAISLLRQLEPFLPGRPAVEKLQLGQAPYAGLRAFQEEDAGRFFGRDYEVAAFATKLRECPLLVVMGPSGVGKSSFVRAGVIPALKRSGELGSVSIVRPGREPMLSLAGVLCREMNSTVPLGENLGAQRDLAQRLRNEPGVFGSELRASARRAGQRALLFVDQFEELYTLGAERRERLAFTSCLMAAADDVTCPVRIVFSLRSDFLDRLLEDPRFMDELSGGIFFLGPPGSHGLQEALVRPCEGAGYSFESDALVDDMVQHLATVPRDLPLLQFTAAQLWEHRDPVRRVLTEWSYQRIGGITGALASHADSVLAPLSPEQQRWCRSIFLLLVTPERTRATRRLQELEALVPGEGTIQPLIDHLIQARLLVISIESGSARVEIVHDALITTWPCLRRWLDESHEEEMFLEQLNRAARQWRSARRDPGLLWSGDLFEELARLQRRNRDEWPEDARAFVAAVFAKRARAIRRKRWAARGSAVLLTCLLSAALLGLLAMHREKTRAEANTSAAMLAVQTAERRLREIEAKERQRQSEEGLRRAEEQRHLQGEEQVWRASGVIQPSNLALFEKNAELVRSAKNAEEARQRAEAAETDAQTNEANARQAEKRALRAVHDLQGLLEREREHHQRLLRRLGRPIVETSD